MSLNTWTKYNIVFNDTVLILYKNDTKLQEYVAETTILAYWLVVFFFIINYYLFRIFYSTHIGLQMKFTSALR